MVNLLDLIIQWVTKGQLPHIAISWWLDAIITLVGIALIFIFCYYADKRIQRLQQRDKALDELIKSHKL